MRDHGVRAAICASFTRYHSETNDEDRSVIYASYFAFSSLQVNKDLLTSRRANVICPSSFYIEGCWSNK